uniref:Alpha-2-macroglobulin-like 1 n=1 Tax=Gasterosteus aculeatus aculeatus TaxID=481459 RepID=A0AAQ4QJC0_GASAC
SIFLVTASSLVRGGEPETLCAQVHGPPEPVNLTVALEADSSWTVLLEEDVTGDFYRCLSFQVPAVRSRTVATIHVTVQRGDASISKKTKIRIERPAFIHLIQTDKPVYKPGQTVQFRIVSMDVYFVPVDRVDPNSNRIAQWLDKRVAGGILDLSHPVIPEAARGRYTITASTDQGEQISHRFDIKEYVLPKYEVKVHLPRVISILDQETSMRKCPLFKYKSQTTLRFMVSHASFCLSVFPASVNKGEFSISLRQVTGLAPFAQVVVYTVMPGGEAVADSHDFPVQLCLNNKVSLKFSSLQELPAGRTTLRLQAHPGSLCSVRAVDLSVLLLQREQELTVASVRRRVDDNSPDIEGAMMLGKEEVGKKETVRTFFPETWIWDLVPVGDGGSVDVEKTVPDTVTKWAAGAFCVSPAGFGVAPNAELTAFQPFFVSLTLPYSVIRGEVFTLKATVFNYLSKCIMVKRRRDLNGRTFSWVLTPTSLGRVDVKVGAEALRTDLLCGNEVAVVPEAGRVDTVVRSLLVEAEGTPQMVSHNALLCPAGERSLTTSVEPEAPPGAIRWTSASTGDLMGRAMKNLDRLLAMPYGCGEQNMVLFAPNVFILNYLRSTNQLTEEVQSRATRFLKAGYQRELTYKHDDGSFSAFGKSDESGNTWLTSFVMKSFGGARPYIFVNDAHIGDARRWLSSLQRPDGCVRSVGRLLHNGMKGGVSDDVSLTAYIAAALLELDANATDPMVQGCLTCLKEAMSGQLENLYTSALMSYTFALAGDVEAKSDLLARLHQNRAGASGKGPDSLEVEMSSYVLLALLSGPAVPGFGLDYSSGIVRWLVQQQNPYGGFSSTQDTVVALQALAKYGAATYSKEGVTTVTVTSLGGPSWEFRVDGSNRLLYQEEELSEVPGEYSLRARGQSCVLAQVSMHYNVPPPPDFSTFNVSTSVMPKCNISRPQLVLFVHVRYQGRREETNMVIINVKLLSGFILDQSSLELSDRSVKRVDVEEGFINVYLDGVQRTKVLSVTVEEDVAVRNLKPAVVKVYDYYQTSKMFNDVLELC